MSSLALGELVKRALVEDLGHTGDLTSAITVPPGSGTARIVARTDGVLSGTSVVAAVASAVDPELTVTWSRSDGDAFHADESLAEISGQARSVLTAERTALNFLGRLSAVATKTAHMVDLVTGTGTRIADTRKTTPGLRALEKEAVRHGGGVNHRFGLHDAILVKDNHIALAGGVEQVFTQLVTQTGHMVRVEVEVDTLTQLDELLTLDRSRIEQGLPPVVHAVLLDNMGADLISRGVAQVRDHPAPMVVEVSGGVDAGAVRELAEAGPDVISIGALTHSAGCLDFGLDI